jgi:GT2 family glycosyltransferase
VPGSVEGSLAGYRVTYQLPEHRPLVSLIIPTRNGFHLIKTCIDSIEDKTSYRNFEILVVDNGSDDPEVLDYFSEIQKKPNVEIIRDDRPFNFARLNNLAVTQAEGELVGLINNDIEVIEPDWLSEMVGLATRDGVGAVGAKLLYTDGKIQHGGVVLGVGGVAGHAFKHYPGDYPGYFSRARLTSSFSAVTAACLVIRKETYLQAGGLDEKNLAIAFNDIDFCLRVRELGLRNVWTPHALLYHHESASRGYEDTPEKQERFAKEVRFMQKRWGRKLLDDPAYSPNLTLEHEDFSFAWPPRV